MQKETEIAAVAAGGGFLTWFVKKFTGRWKTRFDKMQSMVDFWQVNAEKLMSEIRSFQGKYDSLNEKYTLVINQNFTLNEQNNLLKEEVGALRLEIKKLKGEVI